MRLIVYYLLISALVQGCTTVNLINNRLSQLMYVDSAFRPTYYNFFREASKRGLNVDGSKLTIIFGEVRTKENPNIVGTCSAMTGFPLITIDKDFWEASNPQRQEQLMFHEMGHCLLRRDHCSIKDNGKIITIMEPEVLPSEVYKDNRKALIDELFKPREGCQFYNPNFDGVNVCTRQQRHTHRE